jgi:hypothetical protein
MDDGSTSSPLAEVPEEWQFTVAAIEPADVTPPSPAGWWLIGVGVAVALAGLVLAVVSGLNPCPGVSCAARDLAAVSIAAGGMLAGFFMAAVGTYALLHR